MRNLRACLRLSLRGLVLLCVLGTASSCDGLGAMLGTDLYSGLDNQGLPRIDSVTPDRGPTAGGIKLTLTGTNFGIGATVTVAGQAATEVLVWSGTQLTATLPARPGVWGQVPIVVQNPDGSSAVRADLFTYVMGQLPFPLVLLEPSFSAVAFTTGDFNGDHVPDIAAAGGIGATLYLSNGQGGFQGTLQLATGQNPTAVASGDLNGDLKLDVVVANRGSNDVTVLFNDGQGVLTGLNFPVGWGPARVGVFDWNGDRALDILVADIAGTSVGVLYANGRGGFSPATALPAELVSGAIFASQTTADFNGDLLLDQVSPGVLLSLSGVSLGQVRRVLFNYGSTAWDPASNNPLRSGDVDGDGNNDLIFSTGGTDTAAFMVARGNGKGDLSTPQLFANVLTATQLLSFVAADINGDKKTDILFAGTGYPVGSPTLFALLNDGSGHSLPPILSTLGGEAYGMPIATADFNSDGKLDVAVAGSGPPARIFLGNGNGGFTFAAAVPELAPNPADALAAGDFNGDGQQDLVVGYGNSQLIWVLLGNGAGGFASSRRMMVPISGLFMGFAVGDVNGDHRDDVAAANYGVGSYLLYGSETNGLTMPIRIGPVASYWSVTMADYNNDQFIDLLFLSEYTGNTAVARLFWGNATGRYAASIAYPAPGSYGISVDLNNDQKIDIIPALEGIIFYPWMNIVQ